MAEIVSLSQPFAPGSLPASRVRERPSELPPPANGAPRLMERVRAAVRLRHFSRRTEKAYAGWIRRYTLFHGRRHPVEMGGEQVTRFLSHLAVEGKVSASTQNQALSALLFLYRDVLAKDLPWIDEIVRAKRPVRLPVVLARGEVRALLRELDGVELLMASLLYRAGLRLLECCRLRVKDIEFSRSEILLRDGKGGKDRVRRLRWNWKAAGVEHRDIGAATRRKAGYAELSTLS